MTRKQKMLAFLATAVVSATVTALAIMILENEPPVEGAVSATVRSAVLGEDREYFVHLPAPSCSEHRVWREVSLHD